MTPAFFKVFLKVVATETLSDDDVIKFEVSDVHSSVAKVSNLFYRDFDNIEKSKFEKTNILHGSNIAKTAVIKNGCKIGNNFSIGDGSVINEGCVIGNNVKIGGGSGVVKDIEDNQVVMGYPAVPFKEFIKNWKK